MNVEVRSQRTKAEEALAAAYVAARDDLPGNEALRARRDAAFALFEQFGLPHRRVEAWKYTDLRALMRSAAPLAVTAPADALSPRRSGRPDRRRSTARRSSSPTACSSRRSPISKAPRACRSARSETCSRQRPNGSAGCSPTPTTWSWR